MIGGIIQQGRPVARLQRANAPLRKEADQIQSLRETNRTYHRLLLEETAMRQTKRAADEAAGLQTRIGNLRRQFADLDRLRSENRKQALETYFWSLKSGDLEELPRCVALNQRPNNGWPGDQAENIRYVLKSRFQSFGGYRIKQRQVLSPQEVVLWVQSSVNGSPRDFVPTKTNDEWHVAKGFDISGLLRR